MVPESESPPDSDGGSQAAEGGGSDREAASDEFQGLDRVYELLGAGKLDEASQVLEALPPIPPPGEGDNAPPGVLEALGALMLRQMTGFDLDEVLVRTGAFGGALSEDGTDESDMPPEEMWRHEEEWLAKPGALMKRMLDNALAVARAGGEAPPRVRLCFGKRPVAYMVSRRARFPSRGYRIDADLGFPMLVFEVSEYFTAQGRMVTAAGDRIPGREEEFDLDQIRSLVRRAADAYVNKGRRWSYSPEVRENLRRRVFEEARYSERHRRGGVSVGVRALMLLFTVAHELGHIALGHLDRPAADDAENRQRELEADGYAADILLRSVRVPPSWWAFAVGDVSRDTFATHMLQLAADAINHHAPPKHATPASVHKIQIVHALHVVAILFAMHDFIERKLAAHPMAGRPRTVGESAKYPPAAERWAAFRNRCIEANGIPEGIFTAFNGVTGPVNDTFENFLRIVEGMELG